MKILKYLIPIFFLFLTEIAYPSQSTIETEEPAHSLEELQTQIEKVLKDMHVPGVSIAIVNRNGPEWVTGLGSADIANNRKANAETLFRIGSTSKGFVALSVLKLVDQGKLSLQDPIHRLTPEVWFENAWEERDPIRVVNLLEHTTGWDDMHFREYAKESPTITLLEAFEFDHRSRISRWRPSTRMAYCNSGPAVAAYIVEKITGECFEEYVEQNFFKPIGMKTATYFQPKPESITTTYHADGKTPYPYAHIIFRPSGSINASANDMANYLLFYINRGSVNEKQIMPTAAIDRMEIPTSTWAAQEGLKAGYGLSNYWNVNEGFVYHGHDGSIDGGLTNMAYIPDLGVGYFYSINAGNGEAFNKIGKIIQKYITRELQSPPVPPEVLLPSNAAKYTGWYEPDSPRIQLVYFLERLAGLTHIYFEDDKLLMTSLNEKKATHLPVIDSQFRYVPKNGPPEPIATIELLNPNAEGQFIQVGMGMVTMKRIPSWLALSEIILTGFVLLSVTSILIYAPFWIFGGLIKKRRRPAERNMRIWPLIAALSLISIPFICMLSGNLFIQRMGNMTLWSVSLFLVTIIFAIASAVSLIALWRAPKQGTRAAVRIYSGIVATTLLITTLYLAYWGIIGVRTWS